MQAYYFDPEAERQKVQDSSKKSVCFLPFSGVADKFSVTRKQKREELSLGYWETGTKWKEQAVKLVLIFTIKQLQKSKTRSFLLIMIVKCLQLEKIFSSYLCLDHFIQGNF